MLQVIYCHRVRYRTYEYHNDKHIIYPTSHHTPQRRAKVIWALLDSFTFTTTHQNWRLSKSSCRAEDVFRGSAWPVRTQVSSAMVAVMLKDVWGYQQCRGWGLGHYPGEQRPWQGSSQNAQVVAHPEELVVSQLPNSHLLYFGLFCVENSGLFKKLQIATRKQILIVWINR